MANVVLRVVEEPLPAAAKTVVSLHGPKRPVLSGGGRATLLCGACGSKVARRVDLDAVKALVLQCPSCCRYNVVAA